MAHGDDRRSDGRVIRVDGDLPDERPVDLQRVQREVLEIAERRVAGSEIVHREMEAHCPQRVQGLGAFLVVVDQYALGQLETEIPRLETAQLERAADRFAQAALPPPGGDGGTRA